MLLGGEEGVGGGDCVMPTPEQTRYPDAKAAVQLGSSYCWGPGWAVGGAGQADQMWLGWGDLAGVPGDHFG